MRLDALALSRVSTLQSLPVSLSEIQKTRLSTLRQVLYVAELVNHSVSAMIVSDVNN